MAVEIYSELSEHIKKNCITSPRQFRFAVRSEKFIAKLIPAEYYSIIKFLNLLNVLENVFKI